MLLDFVVAPFDLFLQMLSFLLLGFNFARQFADVLLVGILLGLIEQI